MVRCGPLYCLGLGEADRFCNPPRQRRWHDGHDCTPYAINDPGHLKHTFIPIKADRLQKHNCRGSTVSRRMTSLPTGLSKPSSGVRSGEYQESALRSVRCCGTSSAEEKEPFHCSEMPVAVPSCWLWQRLIIRCRGATHAASPGGGGFGPGLRRSPPNCHRPHRSA